MPAIERNTRTGSRRQGRCPHVNRFVVRIRMLTPVAAIIAAVIAAIIACVLALGAAAPSAAFAASESHPRLAIVVLAPYLTFSDLSPSGTPALWKLAETGALGAMNARTGDPDQPTTVSGALTISASRWASVPLTVPAGANDIATLQALQKGSLVQPVLGSLGGAIQAVGGRTAVISTGPVRVAQPAPSRRPGELVAMDTAGHVDLSPAEGTLSATRRGRPTPRGSGAEASFARIAGLALRNFAETAAPALLVVDSPRLAAASESASLSVQASATEHQAAVRELDQAVATLERLAPAGATLMVLAPATHKAWYQVPELSPIIVNGPGFAGEVFSPSTHRAGLVTNLDVAPTVLAVLGIAPPTTMVGSKMTARTSTDPVAGRIAALGTADAGIGIVDQLREAWFIRAFVALTLAITALAVWAIARRPRATRLRSLAAVLVVFLCAIPSAAWLMFVVQRYPQSFLGATGGFAVAAVVVAAMLLGVRWFGSRDGGDAVHGALLAGVSATTLTSVVIVADQWLAEPLRTGLFSYSVRAGWRYYGMGNEGAALLVGASLVAIGLAIELLAGARGETLMRRWAVPVVGAVVLFTAAAPFAGANAGVAIWGVVAYAAAWAGLNGIRPTARNAFITAGLVAGAVFTFVAIDLLAAGGGTHLAKFALGILHGDLSATRLMVGRKLANNLGYFVATQYTLLFLGLGGVYYLIRHSSKSALQAALKPFSALRAALFGAFVGGLLALVTEDSSSVMPALLWFAALMPAMLIVLSHAVPATPDSSASEISSL